MKTVKMLLLMLTIAVSTSAQYLHKLVPKDSKVFIQMPAGKSAKVPTDILNKWGYWKVVPSSKEADFTIRVIDQRIKKILGTRPALYALFVDKNEKYIYTTPTRVNGNDADKIELLFKHNIVKGLMN